MLSNFNKTLYKFVSESELPWWVRALDYIPGTPAQLNKAGKYAGYVGDAAAIATGAGAIATFGRHAAKKAAVETAKHVLKNGGSRKAAQKAANRTYRRSMTKPSSYKASNVVPNAKTAIKKWDPKTLWSTVANSNATKGAQLAAAIKLVTMIESGAHLASGGESSGPFELVGDHMIGPLLTPLLVGAGENNKQAMWALQKLGQIGSVADRVTQITGMPYNKLTTGEWVYHQHTGHISNTKTGQSLPLTQPGGGSLFDPNEGVSDPKLDAYWNSLLPPDDNKTGALRPTGARVTIRDPKTGEVLATSTGDSNQTDSPRGPITSAPVNPPRGVVTSAPEPEEPIQPSQDINNKQIRNLQQKYTPMRNSTNAVPTRLPSGRTGQRYDPTKPLRGYLNPSGKK